uniref:Uncharacterized protein n=1 Tax=Leersia perrieri TaxID=77586 RepID=A0A0D9X3K6_9ORYZ
MSSRRVGVSVGTLVLGTNGASRLIHTKQGRRRASESEDAHHLFDELLRRGSRASIYELNRSLNDVARERPAPQCVMCGFASGITAGLARNAASDDDGSSGPWTAISGLFRSWAGLNLNPDPFHPQGTTGEKKKKKKRPPLAKIWRATPTACSQLRTRMALAAKKKKSVVILLFFCAAASSLWFLHARISSSSSYGKIQSTWEDKDYEDSFRFEVNFHEGAGKYQAYFVLLWKHPNKDNVDARRRWAEALALASKPGIRRIKLWLSDKTQEPRSFQTPAFGVIRLGLNGCLMMGLKRVPLNKV